jgi:hypothetical protein
MDPMGPRRVAGSLGHVPGRSRSVSWGAIFAGAWVVAALLIAAALTSVVGSIVGGGVRAGAGVAGGVPSAVATVAESAAGSAATLAPDATDFGEVSDSNEVSVD